MPPKKAAATTSVFIDESFETWMGLKSPESNFAYGVIFVPSARKDAFSQAWESVERSVINYYVGRNRKPPSELKFSTLAGFKDPFRSALFAQMTSAFESNQVFALGIFATVQGLLNHSVRDDFYSDPAKIKNMTLAERETKAETHRQAMLTAWKAKNPGGDFILTEKLFKYLSGCIGQFQATLRGGAYGMGGPFEICVDSRGVDDDLLKNAFEEQLKYLTIHVPNIMRSYQEMTFGDSKSNPILRCADFVAGMFRQLFVKCPILIEDGSDFSIIDASTPNMVGPFCRRPFSQATVEAIENVSGIVLPTFVPFMSSDLISCFAKQGEARNIDIRNGVFMDMAD